VIFANSNWMKLLRALNQLFLRRRVARNRLAIDKPVSLGFLIKLEFKNVGFYEERKTGVHGRKQINEMKRSKSRINNKPNPLMTHSSGCQPRQLVGIWIQKVGEYKTRFKGYKFKCKDIFELTLHVRWTKHYWNRWQKNNERTKHWFFSPQWMCSVLKSCGKYQDNLQPSVFKQRKGVNSRTPFTWFKEG
jgi:hypothetical protein